MKIAREVFGTKFEIELTEQEVVQAHISYMEKATGSKVGIGDTVMPRKPKILYNDGLLKARDEIDKYRHCPFVVGRIIDEYLDDICLAYLDGMSSSKLAALLNVSPLTIRRHIQKAGLEIKPRVRDLYAMQIA